MLSLKKNYHNWVINKIVIKEKFNPERIFLLFQIIKTKISGPITLEV